MASEPVSSYSVKDGGRLPGGKEAAAIVGSELEVIDREVGEISAQSVVERARTPGTALNAWDRGVHYFQWDDAVAAEEHRLEQARQLIRAVRITVVTGDQKLSTRGFLAVTDSEKRKAYKPVGFVAANPEAHREVLDRFQNEILRIDSAYRAYMAYADFAARYGTVFEAVDRVIDHLAAEGEPRAIQRQRDRYRRQGGHVKLVGEPS